MEKKQARFNRNGEVTFCYLPVFIYALLSCGGTD